MTAAQLLGAACQFIRRWEDCRLNAYRDGNGTWLIGWGNSFLHDGAKVTNRTPPISQAQADWLLTVTVEKVLFHVDALCGPLTDNQRIALTDFVYNLGIGALIHSRLLRRVVAVDKRGAADELLNWTMAGGRHLQGLIERRRAERTLFLS